MTAALEPLPGVTWEVLNDPIEPGRGLMHVTATDPSGSPIAEGHLALVSASTGRRAALDGQVAPGFRRRGIGSAIVQWAEAAAREHFAEAIASGEPVTFRVDVGSVADEGLVQFLALHGLELAVTQDEMRRTTSDPPAHRMPGGIALESWTDGNAQRFHEVYLDAFSRRPGFPGWDFKTWRANFTSSATFRPDLSLLVRDGDRPVAFAMCEVLADEGWIIQTGVAQAARGRGIGAGLMSHLIARFRDDGLDDAVLDVATNNPEARNLYLKLGFVATGTYQSYRKALG